MKTICCPLAAAAALGFCCTLPSARGVDVPHPETLAAREAFAREGLGIFIHWGLYAVWGQGEWYLAKSGMPPADCEAKAAEFNPTNFDARAWVRAPFEPLDCFEGGRPCIVPARTLLSQLP